MLLLSACSSPGNLVADRVLWRVSDPAGDLSMIHPESPGITQQSFDLRKVELAVSRKYLFVTATFAAPVRKIRNVRLSEDRIAAVFPQTVDVYLDTARQSGEVKALEDRGFMLPANQGYERVLVLTSLPDMTEGHVLYPLHLIARGRQLIGIFDRSEVDEPILGALVTVAATSPWGYGRIRTASTFKGRCTNWQQRDCTLLGKGPPILDATSEINAVAPIKLTYINTAAPPPARVPLILKRPPVLGAAPVNEDRIKPGHIATVVDKDGKAIATAVVVSVIGDTATLEVLKGATVDTAEAVTFGESE